MNTKRILEDRYSYISLIPTISFEQIFDMNLPEGNYQFSGKLADMPKSYFLPGDAEIYKDDKWRVVISEKVMREFEDLSYWHEIATRHGFRRAEGHTYNLPLPAPVPCTHEN